MLNHKLKLNLAASLLIVCMAAPSVGQAESYKVTFLPGRGDDDGAMRRAEVVATITPDNGAVRLARSGEDTGLYHQWATFVLDIEASDTNGQPLALTYLPHGVWKVAKWRGGEINLRYELALQHDRLPNEPGDDELAYARPYGVMWTGRALFMEGAPARDIEVRFEAPEGWRVTSPWRASDQTGLNFQPNDMDDLLDSAFFAGLHTETVLNVAGIEARIATGPEMQVALDLYQETLRDYLSEYAKLFGAATAEAPVVIGARGSFWGGGVMGRSISMMAGGEVAPEMAPMVSYIVAHEAFHLWNAQWRYDAAKRPPIEWIAEGSAEYYTKLVGLRIGDIQQEQWMSEIAGRWNSYRAAVDTTSIAEAGRTKLENQTSYDLVYSGGMMVSLALDLMIRRETDNSKSLDDALRLIHRRFTSTGRAALTRASLIRAIRDATGVNIDAFLKQYVDRQNDLPMATLLQQAGLCFVQSADAAQISQCDHVTTEQVAFRSAWLGD